AIPRSSPAVPASPRATAPRLSGSSYGAPPRQAPRFPSPASLLDSAATSPRTGRSIHGRMGHDHPRRGTAYPPLNGTRAGALPRRKIGQFIIANALIPRSVSHRTTSVVGFASASPKKFKRDVVSRDRREESSSSHGSP